MMSLIHCVCKKVTQATPTTTAALSETSALANKHTQARLQLRQIFVCLLSQLRCVTLKNVYKYR